MARVHDAMWHLKLEIGLFINHQILLLQIPAFPHGKDSLFENSSPRSRAPAAHPYFSKARPIPLRKTIYLV